MVEGEPVRLNGLMSLSKPQRNIGSAHKRRTMLPLLSCNQNERALQNVSNTSAEFCSRSQQSRNSRNMLLSMLMDGYADNGNQMFINHVFAMLQCFHYS
jgi:hypothetical protein